MHHHRPFFVDGFPDVLPDQPAQSVARFRGELGRQHDGGPERAGFAVDCRLGAFVVVPYLRRGERDNRPNTIPSGGSMPGDTALKDRA
jgi:hypothetical protein